MKLLRLGPNAHALDCGDAGAVLFSYERLTAVRTKEGRVYRMDEPLTTASRAHLERFAAGAMGAGWTVTQPPKFAGLCRQVLNGDEDQDAARAADEDARDKRASYREDMRP